MALPFFSFDICSRRINRVYLIVHVLSQATSASTVRPMTFPVWHVANMLLGNFFRTLQGLVLLCRKGR